MNLNDFLQHWNLVENPFQGEEARTDRVFGRMNGQGAPALSLAEQSTPMAAYHAEFERVLGDLRQPASSVVFGEKGSGKTAMRLQIAARIRAHNADHPESKVLLVSYDELNPYLAKFLDRAPGKTPAEKFAKLRLADHLDIVLQMVVSRLVDAALGDPQPQTTSEQLISVGPDAKRTLRGLDRELRRDMLLLQALYDRPVGAEFRTRRLRRRLGLRPSIADFVARFLLIVYPLSVIGFFAWGQTRDDVKNTEWFKYTLLGSAGAYVLLLLLYLTKRVFAVRQLGRRLRKQIPTAGRGFVSFARSMACVDGVSKQLAPLNDSPETRFALVERLRRVLSALGVGGIIVIMDRVDEPPLIAGDPDRMRALVWPLLNNKVLQLEGVGFKLLLPIELRHMLYKESNAFFQEARLDKGGFVDRLNWTGASLYDLCESRLRACTRAASMGVPQGGAGLSLVDLFADDCTRQDLVDSLEQMHQPRDAFKFMHRCITEHCATVTGNENRFRIPRFILEVVRKQEVERVQALYRGIRPA